MLITGACGRIGSHLARAFAGQYDLTLTDVAAPAEPPGAPFARADIADLDALRPLCRGVDTVVHLAADPRTFAPWEALLPANVVGAYNLFQAAHEAGCRRVVFASTVNAVAGYPAETQVHTSQPVRPLNLYGATKAWGEALACFYADQHGLSAICLRFGAVVAADNAHWINRDSQFLDIVLTMEDMTRLVAASVEAPDTLRFGIYHGLSNNRFKRLDLSDARRDLGYEPLDDAFAIAESR